MTKAKIEKEVTKRMKRNDLLKKLTYQQKIHFNYLRHDIVNFITANFCVSGSLLCPKHKKQLYQCGDGGYRCQDCYLQ